MTSDFTPVESLGESEISETRMNSEKETGMGRVAVPDQLPKTGAENLDVDKNQRDRQGAQESVGDDIEDGKNTRGLRFWCIMFALSISGILSALEGTVVSTALPTIVQDLGGAELYTWAVNGYFLTSMVFQPLYGQMANIFGRRWLLIAAISLFVIGSAIGGAAQNMAMLIVGRVIQGTGGGGISMLANLIISDIVPLRERGHFMAIALAAVMVGTGMGPFVGGIIVQRTTWRWVFLLNIPIGGFALALVIAFLNVQYDKETTLKEKFKRIDFFGNIIFIASVVAILIALTWGGTTYPWRSWRVLLSLVLGFAGFGAFYFFESSKYCLEPTTPPHLFKNRTTATAFSLAFLNSMVLYWLLYYLPVYFQGVYGSSPSRSGVQLLPTVLIMMPFAMAGGKLLAKFGKYRPVHFTGFALATIGMGCMTLLKFNSSTAAWVCFQALVAAGLGLTAATTLPAVLAPLEEKDTATATGTWAFLKSFGTIWGVTIPSVVFNNQFDHLSGRISDPGVRALISNGHAYEHATKLFIDSYSGPLREEIVSVYSDSLKTVWQVGIGAAGLGFLLAFLEKEIKLRTKLNTEFGISEKDGNSANITES